MTIFRKKPVEIEAHRWFEGTEYPEKNVVRQYSGPDRNSGRVCQHCGTPIKYHGEISTLEGVHIVCSGDWIITGVAGEKYPCKPDIFAATYDEVTSGATALKCNGQHIVIATQGFVFLCEDWERDGDLWKSPSASVIRVWGTKYGLGEIAINGPTEATILDPLGELTLPHHAVVAMITCTYERGA